MRVNLLDRQATLSVGEFAEFRHGPASGTHPGRAGRWRAELGQVWHRELQNQAEAETAAAAAATGAGAEAAPPGLEAAFEVPINAGWALGDWTLELQGRIDQVLRDTAAGTARLREVKTVRAGLPRDRSELEADYGSYFNQLAAYVTLAGVLPEYDGVEVTGELVFVDIADGIIQPVPLGREELQARFERQAERLLGFLEGRRRFNQGLRQTAFKPAFALPRPGQEEAREQLAHLALNARHILLEAPTGFGKTGTVLEYALGRLRDGLVDRVVYLTGKSTGQLQVVRTLRAMAGVGSEADPEAVPGLHYFQMRNRQEHAIASPRHTCDDGPGCREGIEERWEAAAIVPADLYREGTVRLKEVRALGEATGVCPYEISRAALRYADVWVGDFNYVFSPSSSGVFFNQPGFDPGQSLLVVDEAHNLPSRAAGAFSHQCGHGAAEAALAELQFSGAPAALRAAFGHWADFLASLQPQERLDPEEEYEAAGLLERLAEQLEKAAPALSPEALSPAAWAELWACFDREAFFTHDGLEKLVWSPDTGRLNLTCLDAAAEIGAALGAFGQTVLTSATLAPVDLFRRACGLEAATSPHLEAGAPWRDGAYAVAVDLRADTRFRARERHYPLTADTVKLVALAGAGPAVVFFPSYRYAEAVREYVLAEPPGLRVALQPRGADLAAQNRFVEEALLTADALFLVLGSSFSESIDLLGGRVDRAMVVGPALPEVNPVQRAKLEARERLGRDEAFRQVYLVPALTKINQALGRLVRAPGQTAKVLLHCRRFAQPATEALLAEDYRGGARLQSREEVYRWLEEG